MKEEYLIEKHNEILDYFLDYKKENSDFIFSPRKQHNDVTNNHLNCRLCKGYWFQGANNYIFVPLYKRGCKDNKTKTIGFVIEENSQYIEIVYKKVDDITSDEYKMYDELVSFLQNSSVIKEVKRKKNNTQYICLFNSSNLEENLNYFIKVFRKKADELIMKYGFEEKYFISEEAFESQLNEIKRIKEKIKRGTKIDTVEDFERAYYTFVNSLALYGGEKYTKLYTLSQNKPFKVYKNSQNSIVVFAFTNNATSMVITLNQLKKVFFEKASYLYASYEQVLIDRIVKGLLVTSSEIFEEDENISAKINYIKTKNIILYGAPGVGKTHNVNKLITMIEDGNSEHEIFEAIQNNDNQTVILEEDLKKRVNFVTFHQSFGYEDFIEGFRPDEKGDIQLEDGIFKEIVNEASTNIKVVSSEHITFDDAYDIVRMDFIDEVLEPLKTVTEKEIEVKDIQDKFLKVKTVGAKNEHYIKKTDLEIVVDAVLNDMVERPSDIKKLAVKKDTIALAGYYYPFAIRIVETIKDNKLEVESEKNFYLVIDEINRGNISKIFGELITLIEESKRGLLEVQLPYSKKTFKVPSNLYIIGTMNSTDKSIALIDIALRRRFTFLKMEPNLELVPEFARELFQSLNEQIIKDLGLDYQLGHSYFMNTNKDELELVLKYKIEPLLEEYYYGNTDGLENIFKVLYPNK